MNFQDSINALAIASNGCLESHAVNVIKWLQCEGFYFALLWGECKFFVIFEQ